MDRPYKIGIVLSGGGARGFAHLGVIQSLIENNIFPGVVSGTSAGAIVGALFADGYEPKEIMKIFNSTSRLHYIRPAVPNAGFFQISGIIKILRENLRATSFEELKIPLFVCATDLNHGKAVYFSEGELINPIIASASIPVLFNPVVINNISFVDGGVLDNLPVNPVEKLCRFLIGSFVNPTGYLEKFSGIMDIAERTFMLNVAKEVALKSGKFDLFVAPSELRNYKILDPEKAQEVYEIGYDATNALLNQPEIMKIFKDSSGDRTTDRRNSEN
jgi:NTE family protein